MWHTGSVAPRHVGSSWTRAQTRVSCIGRWILNHCTTREVPRPVLDHLCISVKPHLTPGHISLTSSQLQSIQVYTPIQAPLASVPRYISLLINRLGRLLSPSLPTQLGSMVFNKQLLNEGLNRIHRQKMVGKPVKARYQTEILPKSNKV